MARDICCACYLRRLEAHQLGHRSHSPCVHHKELASEVASLKESKKQMEEKLTAEMCYLTELIDLFKEHSDILLKPGDNGPPIPAHIAILAGKSRVFKYMLESDECKAPPTDGTITLEEFKHEELESLLEFLYTGKLCEEKAKKHLYSLAMAAHKYEISCLDKFCEDRMRKYLDASTVLDIIRVADKCSINGLIEDALSYVVRNKKEVVLSQRFQPFALANPHLTLQIIKAFVNFF